MKCLFVTCLLLLPTLTLANEQFVIGQSSNAKEVVGPTQYGNTPQGEHAGDVPWVNRDLTKLQPFLFWFKDTNELFAYVDLDYLRLYFKPTTGSPVLVAEFDPPSLYHIASQWWFANIDHNLTIDGAAVGQTLEYYFEVRYRNASFVFNTDQYWLRIKIAPPLPSASGWYSAETHFHSLTDDLYEYGDQFRLISKAAPVVGIQFVPMTDHSYDLTTAEWDSTGLFCQHQTTATRVFSRGLETNTDNDNIDQAIDGFNHQLVFKANQLIPAPSEYGADHQSTHLWTQAQLLTAIANANGRWMAAHPFSTIPFPDSYQSVQYTNANIIGARSDPNFNGWEIWNTRTTMKGDVDEDYANPFTTFAPIPNWDADLLRGIGIVDSLRQTEFSHGSMFVWSEPLGGQSIHATRVLRSYMSGGTTGYLWLEFTTTLGYRVFTNPIWIGANPGRKDFWFGGSDAHGSFNYHMYLRSTGGLEASDNAFGRNYNYVRAIALTETSILDAFAAGRSVMTDGPLGYFAVDVDNNGTGEIELGGSAFGVTNQTKLIIDGLSSTEFGDFTSVKIHVFQTGPIVGVGNTPSLPVVVRAYPNPFSGVVTMDVTTSQRGLCDIIIYDVAGRMVNRFSRTLSTDASALVWDGTDQRGQRVASGQYFATISIGQYAVQQKITLLR